MLVIAGEIPRRQIGKQLGAVHEIWDQSRVAEPVIKWHQQVNTPGDVPGTATEAFRQMRTGRPRPVLINFPPEVGVERDDVQLCNPAPIAHIAPSPDQLRDAAALVAKSSFPLIFAGGGVIRSGAEAALREMVEKTNIPVITSPGGKGSLPDDHPLCYGSCISPSAKRQEINELHDVMQSSDLVIGVGTRFSLGNPAGESSTFLNINIDDSELTRVQANTIPLHGDARATLKAWTPHLVEAGAGDRPSPADSVTAARQLIAYHDIRFKEPQYPILEAVNQAIPPDAHVAWDVTQFGNCARTHYKVNHPNTYIDSGYSFNLGYSFPTALGAKVAAPHQPAFAICGDGGFLFNATELATAVRYKINVVTIVFRNDSYGNVANDLDELFDGIYETDLVNPDLVKFAESFGAIGMRAKDPMDLVSLIPRALELAAPVVIDVPVGDMHLTRAHFLETLPKLAWTHPQDGLIGH